MSPTAILPCIVKYPPKIATATYPTFPIKFVTGYIKPDRNCDLHADLYNTLFAFINSSVAFSSPLKAFTTV